MRYDSEHKQRTRERVVAAAAKAVRLHGPDNIGIAALMSQAGLTHGGFYAHFGSKDELIQEAITLMFEESASTLEECLEGLSADAGLAALIDRYLSREHLEQREAGCPMAALASDLPRMSSPVREAFEQGVKKALEALAALLQEVGYEQPRELARSVQMEMVGALTLARAVPNPSFAMKVLESSRAQIRARLQLH